MQYNACFHDLATGVQTHVYAPLGLDIKEKWSIGGSLPGEPVQPVELGLGVPKQGLYLREDCDMRCNIVMTKFVRGTLTKAHKVLVDRLVEKAGLEQVKADNQRISVASSASGSISGNPASSLVGGSNDVTTAAGFPASPTLSSSGTFSDAASIDNIPSLMNNSQPPHYHEQPPTYAELPSLQPSLAAHQAQAQAAQAQRSSTPQVQDFEKQRPASGAAPAPATGEPFPPYADTDFVPEPLKPRKAQRHSYMAYQPAAYSNANNNRLSYAAYRPPPPQHGYSAYRPHSNVQQQQHLMPQQYPGHQRSHSAGAVPSAAVAPSPVELEG